VIQDVGEYNSSPPIESKFKKQFKAWRIIAFMRWVTFIIGPLAILIDRYLQPWLVSMGLPSIVTMEDFSLWLMLDVLRLSKWIDVEDMLELYHHINWVSCILFIVFVGWHILAKKRATKSARDLTLLEEKMRGGI
tara:strand:- start:2271 stop:2675 length:405 start_codon:yes stop_codon:yes gene_type:complete